MERSGMETKTAEWELVEIDAAGNELFIAAGAEDGIRWLGSITVPRHKSWRIVMRPAEGEEA
jgi:hypothetical protein